MKQATLRNATLISALGTVIALQSASAAVTITSSTPNNTTVNLTTVGTLDWNKFSNGTDFAYFAEKAGASQIGSISTGASGNGTTLFSAFNYNGAPMTWTDGATPNTTGTAVNGSWEVKSGGTDSDLVFLTFDITNALAGDYRLLVYASYYRSAYSFSAALDGGASHQVTGGATSAAATPTLFTIDYTATANQTLTITYSQTAEGSSVHDNIGIAGIALSAVPEPSSAALLSLGLVGFLSRRRRN